MIDEDLFVATCASNLTSGTVKLIFPGETTASGKYYKVLNTTGITNGTRVIVAKTSGTYVVVSAFNVGGGGGGSGTVTSVGIKNTGGLTVSGSPITTSGEISIGHNNPAISPKAELGLYPIKFNIYGHIIDSGAPVYPTNKNLLDNWYFVGGGTGSYGVFPVNQRGQLSYSTYGYCIDRWRINSNSSLTVSSDCITYSSNQVTGYQEIRQWFSQDLPAGTYTLSLLAEITSIGGTVWWGLRDSGNTIKNNVPLSSGSGYRLFTLTFTLDSTAHGWSTSITTNNASSNYVTANIKAWKLETGDTQTLAHQESGTWVLNELPNYSEELTKCMRYFQKIKSISGGTYDMIATGSAISSTRVRAFIPTSVSMASLPSLSKSGSMQLALASDINNTYFAVTSVSTQTQSNLGIIANLDVSSGLAAGSAYFLRNGNDSSAYLALSCEPSS